MSGTVSMDSLNEVAVHNMNNLLAFPFHSVLLFKL
jgi:hypothetical protein